MAAAFDVVGGAIVVPPDVVVVVGASVEPVTSVTVSDSTPIVSFDTVLYTDLVLESQFVFAVAAARTVFRCDAVLPEPCGIAKSTTSEPTVLFRMRMNS